MGMIHNHKSLITAQIPYIWISQNLSQTQITNLYLSILRGLHLKSFLRLLHLLDFLMNLQTLSQTQIVLGSIRRGLHINSPFPYEFLCDFFMYVVTSITKKKKKKIFIIHPNSRQNPMNGLNLQIQWKSAHKNKDSIHKYEPQKLWKY